MLSTFPNVALFDSSGRGGSRAFALAYVISRTPAEAGSSGLRRKDKPKKESILPPPLSQETHEEHHVQRRDDQSKDDQNNFQRKRVLVFSHDLSRRSQVDLQENRYRKLDTQNHLRNDESVKRVGNEEYYEEREYQRNEHAELRVPILDVIRLIEYSGEYAARGHSRSRARGNAREEQRNREHDR